MSWGFMRRLLRQPFAYRWPVPPPRSFGKWGEAMRGEIAEEGQADYRVACAKEAGPELLKALERIRDMTRGRLMEVQLRSIITQIAKEADAAIQKAQPDETVAENL